MFVYVVLHVFRSVVVFFKQKTAYDMRISDWSSDVCSSDLDVILFGPANSYDHPPIRRETADSILFSSGRPVLIVPDGYKAKAIEHVAIGWNATREATHALRDATAFASPGAKIDILVLDAKPSVKGHESEPGADIARHLARHGRSEEHTPELQ